jgi:hypothetical protein
VTRDEAFEALLPGVLKVPIRMGYHYLATDHTWREQADKYLQCIKGVPYHAHVCDFETAFNTVNMEFVRSTWNWIDYVAQRTGQPTLLYTNYSLYGTWIYPSEKQFGIDWDKVPFWQAQYLFTPDPNKNPSTPTGRTNPWKFWQYTETGNGYQYGTGRPKALDLDVFNGTVTDLKQFLGIDDGTVPPTDPPPTGGTMKKGTLKTGTSALNVRSGPSQSYPVITVLYTGDTVYGLLEASGWLNAQKIVRKSGATETLNGYCNASYLDLSDVPDPSNGAYPMSVSVETDTHHGSGELTMTPN